MGKIFLKSVKVLSFIAMVRKVRKNDVEKNIFDIIIFN